MFSQITQQVDDEQRASFGMAMNQLQELVWKIMARKRHLQVALQVAALQEVQGQLRADAFALKLELDAVKRMRPQQHFRGPIGRDHQHTQINALPAKKSQEI